MGISCGRYIEETEKWDYTRKMNKKNETKEFIKYMEKIIGNLYTPPPTT
jgi:hypothetical protein